MASPPAPSGKMPSSTLPPDHTPASTLPSPTPTTSEPSSSVHLRLLDATVAAFGGELVDVQLGQHRQRPEEHDAQRHAQQRAIVAESLQVANRLLRHVPREIRATDSPL